MAESWRLPGRAGTGLSYGLLAWVLAGHAAALWLAQASLATGPDRLPPKVLRVHWVEAVAVAPAPQPRPRPAPAKPTPARVVQAKPLPPAPEPPPPVPVPVPEPPHAAPEPVPEPAVPAPVVSVAPPPVAEPVRAVAPVPEPRPPVSLPPPPALQPPSYHADYLANPAPAYPAISRRMHEEGTVRLRVLVGPDGLAREIRLDAGSGYPRLDDAARAAVAGWRFLPARLGDRPVTGWVVVPISFSLKR